MDMHHPIHKFVQVKVLVYLQIIVLVITIISVITVDTPNAMEYIQILLQFVQDMETA
jgi:hypothetical protein